MTFKEYKRKNDIINGSHPLYLNDKNLTDIYGIEEFKNLKILSLNYNNIEDIEPLKYLTKLTDIGLSNNEIKDISSLKNLKDLKRLHIDHNFIEDISLEILLNMNNLIQLNLYKNNFSEIYDTLYGIKSNFYIIDEDLKDLKILIIKERRKRLIKLL